MAIVEVFYYFMIIDSNLKSTNWVLVLVLMSFYFIYKLNYENNFWEM